MLRKKVNIDILQKIYDLTLKGYSKKEIAELLNLSATTVEKYQKKYDFL